MRVIRVRDETLDIDIRSELEQYEWVRARWTEDKMQAASPFRYDNRPSFFVNLTGDYAGTWADSGAYTDEWASGNFVKLLAFLRQETYEETEDYLISTYGEPQGYERKQVRLPPIRQRRKFEPLPETLVTPAYSRYLAARGIGKETQAMYGVGYGRQRGFTAIPWRMPNGSLANVMYRATRGKLFFYEKGGYPRRLLVYGIDVVREMKSKLVALCEAPIDAMSWYEASAGEVVGIATGGVTISNEQADLIKRSSIETIILAGDNDKAGEKFNEMVFEKLRGHARLMYVDYADEKDMNDYLRVNKAIPHYYNA